MAPDTSPDVVRTKTRLDSRPPRAASWRRTNSLSAAFRFDNDKYPSLVPRLQHAAV